jgi:hypothetical protein
MFHAEALIYCSLFPFRQTAAAAAALDDSSSVLELFS